MIEYYIVVFYMWKFFKSIFRRFKRLKKDRYLKKQKVGFLDEPEIISSDDSDSISEFDEISEIEHDEIIKRPVIFESDSNSEHISECASYSSSGCHELCYCDYYDFNIEKPHIQKDHCHQNFHGYRKLTMGLYSEISEGVYTELNIQLYTSLDCPSTCFEKKGNFVEFPNNEVYYKYKKNLRENGYSLFTEKLFFRY